MPIQFACDLDNAEAGYVDFGSARSPVFVTKRIASLVNGEPFPPMPGPDYKKCIRVRCKLPDHLVGPGRPTIR
jgi:hypothetical protein